MGRYKGALKFIGCGSAFNVRYGNNNAYIKKGNSLLLIDCGSLTFNKIVENKLLERVDNLFVLITHTHSDHIGSLGDLIAYCYYILKRKIHIIYPNIQHIKQYLNLVGMSDEVYSLINKQEIYNIKTEDFNIVIEPIKVEHVNNLMCYGYVLNYDNKTIYFSGDSSKISDYVLNKFYNNEIDCLYQDTCGYDFRGNPHLYIDKLCKYIKPSYRQKVYCMHFDEKFDFNKVLEYGFNLVENEY
ncbi:MBL fold metallo-hydrolase [Clostridium ganghwense]|uniref:MBL fold metallo-hydrolase n=1 Tax=Clostridium ganghwense TaxID=312089 RepID=A0ABT4CTH0_9CLOT|nr:MBL fold metallo-hydrolase [Clostridium ganghwense]MCY6371728.1 MBL fold metallo-hydrolase [Clostridium ganghwense]